MLQNGEIIDGVYRIEHEIGNGGTGVIYLGYHLRLKKYVVIKRLRDQVVNRIDLRAEVDILKRLHHRNLPQVYDFLEVTGGIYTVMEYIQGHDLQHYLDQGYAIPEKTLRVWMAQLCDVLDYLHSRRPMILHSDIKPANIMITQEGDVCLIDFNISIDEAEGMQIKGISPHYAAPEQYAAAMDPMYMQKGGTPPDERIDIYSLGAMFYMLMTRILPDPQIGAPYPIMELELPYSDGFKAVVAKAMEYQPEDRFESAARMGKALARSEKMDPAYRRYTRLQLLSCLMGGLGIVLGVILIYAGFVINRKDAWHEAYTSFYEAVDGAEDTRALTEGTAMLNDPLTASYMKRNPERKAELLHAMGDSYFRQENYDSAAEYYEDAMQIQKEAETKESGGASVSAEEEIYFRDYLVSLARSGRYEEAERKCRKNEDQLPDNAQTVFVRAEIAYAKGDWEEALARAEEALAVATDVRLRSRIYTLRSEIDASMGRYVEAAEAAVMAEDSYAHMDLKRRAGAACYEAGNAVRYASDREKWYETSLSYYEELCAAESPAYEDEMNRALLLRSLERYGESMERLKELREAYPDDYKIPMWICYNLIDQSSLAGKKGRDEKEEREEKDLQFYYGVCKNLYDGSEDQNMEALKQWMGER